MQQAQLKDHQIYYCSRHLWLISFLAGLGMGLANPPTSLWLLAWVAMVPLGWEVRQRISQRQQGLPLGVPLGAVCWGLGYHGWTFLWILDLHPLTWLGIPWLASGAIALFCWLFITLWGTALVTLWVWLLGTIVLHLPKLEITNLASNPHPSPLSSKTQHHFRFLLLGAALWCTLETLWSQGPLYWGGLSLSQSPHNLAILHLAQWTGPYGIVGAIVTINGLLAILFPLPVFVRFSLTNLTKSCKTPTLVLTLILFLGLHSLGFWLYKHPLTDSQETALQVGIVQGNIPTRIKLTVEGMRRSIQAYTQGYQLLADQGVEVVLTPEGALPMIWEGMNPYVQAVERGVADRHVPLWLGTFLPEGKGYTQSLIALTGEGQVASRYNKVKLVPLGEYMPLESTLGKLLGRLSPIESSLVPGSFSQRFETPWGLAAVAICYEPPFTELIRTQVAAGAEFIFTASNLDPYDERLMAQHLALDVMRAIETDRWLVRATNTGYSGLIDAHGRTIWRAPAYEFVAQGGTLYRRQSQTLYGRWGNWLTPGLWGVVGLWEIFLRVRQVKRSS